MDKVNCLKAVEPLRAVYVLPLGPRKILVLIWLTWEE